MATMEERIQRLEDIEEIRRLRTNEVLAWDRAINMDNEVDLDEIVHHFTQDAILDVGPFGRYQGHAAIRSYLAEMASQLNFCLHNKSGLVIDLEPGETEATSQSYCLETETIGGQALLVGYILEERYRKVGGRWYVSHFKISNYHMTPFERCWVREPISN